MDDQHIPSTLRSQTEDQEAQAEDSDLEKRDTDPCPSMDEEESPESDGKPIEYPHLRTRFAD